MEINKKEFKLKGIKFLVNIDGKDIARASLYLIKNDLHDKPYGLMEDVFVEEIFRGQGMATKLVNLIINEAKKNDCYKLIATSKQEKIKVHELYNRLGFRKMGVEFRIDL